MVAAWAGVGTISLGALVGFFTVLGIAARNGIMMITHFQHLERDEGVPFGRDLVLRGARERLSPILMTSLAAGLAVVPLVVLGSLPGHEIEHSMAVVIIGGLVYMVPFVLSHLYGSPTYGESGLGLVFRENVVRFFQPFDHMGPIYLYLAYLPIYTLPWAPCWILGLWVAVRNWKQIEPNTRWLIWGLGLLFAFFTASGSRRSYYVLPLVPFAQLLAAWWITERMARKRAAGQASGQGWARGIGAAAVFMLLLLGVAYPWSNGGGGVIPFAREVRTLASESAPWSQWKMVMIEVDNKLPMYLQNGGSPFYYVVHAEDVPREGDSTAFMAWLEKTSGQRWDPKRTLIFAQYQHREQLPLPFLADDHQVVLTQPNNGERLFRKKDQGSVAYIPNDEK